MDPRPSFAHFRPRARLARVLAGLLPLALVAGACESPEPEPALPGILVEDVGLRTPESVLHDPVADVYLVSNIHGAPLEADGNGFISRLSPEGEVLDLRWIDGEAEGVTLNAPKGMAILGDVLWVTDIDHLRGFDRETGEPVREIAVEGATFLNDLAADPDEGVLYVSDTGMTAENGEFVPSGSAAVHRVDADGTVTTLVAGEELGGPNGLAVSDRGLIVASFGTGQLHAVQPGGELFEMMPASDRQLDGVIALPDRGFLLSDWSEGMIFRIQPDGSVEAEVVGLQSPADIGFDASRNRLLIPLFMDDAVLITEVEVGPGMDGA